MKYWLLKTEPETFSIDDLRAAPGQVTPWEGVRNYQARNFIRDEMSVGDRVLIYHSGGTNPAIVGTAKIKRAGYPDHFAWDRSSNYFDESSSSDNPRWFMVDVQFESTFATPLTLTRLRETAELSEMGLLRKGNRLSVQPVKKAEFSKVLRLLDSRE